MICPDCKGKKEIFGIGCGENIHCRPMFLPCLRCNGIGKVPNEMKEWIKTGNKYRRIRLKKRITLRKQAKKLGILPSLLSRMEGGYLKPDEGLLKKYKVSQIRR